MRLRRITALSLALFAFAAGCGASEEDRQNAATRVEMETAQAAIIDAAGQDCGAMYRGLNEWYTANQAAADQSDAWWNTMTDDEKDDIMEAHQPDHGQAYSSRIRAMIYCGGVPWFSDRS